MALSVVSTSIREDTTTAISRTITVPSGVQNGDFILISVTYASGSNSSTASGLTGLIELGDSQASGITSSVYYKQNCSASDAGTVVTITLSTALRCAVMCVVFRGVSTSGTVFDVNENSAGAYATAVVTGTGVTSIQATEIQIASGSRTDALASWTPPAGMTTIQGAFTSGAQPNVAAAIAWNATPRSSSTTLGGDTWTPSASVNWSTWTLGIQETVSVTAPTVTAGASQTVASQDTVTLTATSSGPSPTSWQWTQLTGTTVALNGSGASRTFTAPAGMTQGALTFGVRAYAGANASNQAVASVSVRAHKWWDRYQSSWRPLEITALPGENTNLVGDSSTIACWGDSLTQGAGGGNGGWVTILGSRLTEGRVTYNGGKGGETSQEIAIRQGGLELTLSATGGSIPASGSVAMTFLPSIVWSTSIAWSCLGTVAGIEGTLARAVGASTLTFTRTSAGSVTACSSQEFTSKLGGQYQDNVQVLWAGRNDYGIGSDQTVIRNRVLASNAAMSAYLSDNDKPYIIMSSLTRTVENTSASGVNLTYYNNILATNAALATVHGEHYLDIRTYLVQHGLADAGITPTTADNDAMSANTIPPSLTTDGLHLTTAAYTVVANQVEAKLIALHYIPGVVVTPPSSQYSPGLAWTIPSDINDTSKYPQMVFPHYFTPYPISVDNLAPSVTSPYTSQDAYARVWNNVNSGFTDEHTTLDGNGAVSNNHYMKNHGGYFKGRPMPRPPIASNYKIEDCKTDIRQAVSTGWNGFFVEILGLSGGNYDNSMSLIAAGTALYPTGGFRLVPQLDGNGVTGGSTNYAAVCVYLKKFYDAPTKWLLDDGRFVVATFKHEAQTPAHWDAVSAQMLSDYGITIAWIGIFNSTSAGGNYPNMYASGHWGSGSNPGTAAGQSNTYMNAVRSRGQKWMPPAWPQDVRPRSQLADEALGFGSLIEHWKKCIGWNADFVLGATWSDFSEGSNFNVTAHAGWCNLDVSSYFITRLKTGFYPAITRDVVYLAHRNQFWDATLSQMTAGVQTTRMALWNRGSNTTPKADIVETLTFLTAPAQVTVTVGGVSTEYTAPGGMYSNKVALRAGAVSVVVKRNNIVIQQVTSPVMVTATPKSDDLEYYKFSSLRGTDGQFSSTNQAPSYGNTQPLVS